MHEQEIWKTVEGFGGAYKVSNFGNLIMFYQGRWQPKSSYITNAGYLQTTLQRNGVKRRSGIHQLVAEAFVEGWFKGAEVNHKDLNKLNNKWNNLEWVSRKENQKHQYKAYHKDYTEPICKICGKELSSSRSELCFDCYTESRRKNWPSKEEMLQDLLQLNKSEIKKKYSKSEKWIKKVCKAYNLPYKKEEIVQFKKEQY